LSVDPLTSSYPELTPYQFAHNSPIVAIDLDGLEAEGTNDEIDETFKGGDLPTVHVTAKAEGSNSNQSGERYGYSSGAWNQYQSEYGLAGWSYENYSNYYDQAYGEAHDAYVAQQDQIESERKAGEKMKWALYFFKAIEDIQYILGGGTAASVSSAVKASRIFGGKVFQSSVTGNILVSGNAKWGLGGKLNSYNLTPTPNSFFKINSNYPKFGFRNNCSNCTASINNNLQFGEFTAARPLQKPVFMNEMAAQYGNTAQFANNNFISLGSLQKLLQKLPNDSHLGLWIYRGPFRDGHIVHGQVHSGFIKILDPQPRGITYPLRNIEGGTYNYINTTGLRGSQIIK